MRHDASVPAAARTALAPGAPARPRSAPALVAPGRLAAGLTGGLALAVILVAVAGLVLVAASGPSVLVPRSGITYPAWEAGPLRHLIGAPRLLPTALGERITETVGVMLLAYLLLLATARRLPMALLAGAVVVAHAILLLGPPLQLNDVFNYLGYARLGALHDLNPYTHGMTAESLDPVFRFTSWHDLASPYGELFTLISYPLAFLPLSLAYWVVKVGIVLLSLAFLWLVCACARRLGRDPRAALALVAFNPIYLVYAVGGFHNDFVMLVPSMAAIAFVLHRRDGAAGAALVLAVAVKFTAILIAPFLLLALATRPRILRGLLGAALAFVPVLVVSLIAFGTALPNVGQQSSLLSEFDVPNLVGLLFGVGGSPLVLHLATLAVVLVAVYELTVRRGDWLAGAGWTTLALILALSWEVPWYVVWVLPLAALSRRRGLTLATLLVTVFLLGAYAPATVQWVQTHRVPLYATPAGRASRSLQGRLEN